RAGLAGGAALLLRTPSRAASDDSSTQPLITKAMPSSGEKLPVMGLGTDQFRHGERDAIQAEIQRMQQMGGTVIDTAAAYGGSEEIIGESLAKLGIRGRMFLATKLTENEAGTSTASGEASFQRSLQHLQTDHIDLLQVHNLEGVEALMP